MHSPSSILIFLPVPQILCISEPRKKNITKEEYQAIRSLKHNNEIIIKPAYYGIAIVIMDKASYITEEENSSTTLSSMNIQKQTSLERLYIGLNLTAHDVAKK